VLADGIPGEIIDMMNEVQVHSLSRRSGAFEAHNLRPESVDQLRSAFVDGDRIRLTVYSQYPEHPRLPLTPETFSVVGRIVELESMGSTTSGEVAIDE